MKKKPKKLIKKMIKAHKKSAGCLPCSELVLWFREVLATEGYEVTPQEIFEYTTKRFKKETKNEP